jgi:hypothetical protein
MLKVGFHRAKLSKYTGFKSSPYTDGALFYAEKLVVAAAKDAITAQAELLMEPLKEVACAPGGA